MDGLKVGRMVYLVLSEAMVAEITRRRTTGQSIAQRIDDKQWPIGAQAHVGADVAVGQLVSAVVVRVVVDDDNVINVKAFLDGSDEYWAQNVPYNAGGREGTWGWMFDGQNTRYDATKPH